MKNTLLAQKSRQGSLGKFSDKKISRLRPNDPKEKFEGVLA